MRKNSLNLRVLVAVCVTFAGCRAVRSNSESDIKFIGGEAAFAGEYPASVYFEHCTAAKVGPKHFLMAAHCLYQNELMRPSFKMVPGSKANILVGISLERGKLVPVTITSSTPYPGFDYNQLKRDYAKLDVKPGVRAEEKIGEEGPVTVDLAVVTIQEESPELPTATFDEAPIVIGAPLTIGGYGCEQEVSDDNPLMRLKYAQVPPALIKGAMVSWKADSATDGYRSTCHGDSGGPVYRNANGDRKIVGVNSGSPTGYSVFTTLAGPAGANGLAWVKKKLAEPIVVEKLTFKVMKCAGGVPASEPSADGVLRAYKFSDLKLAVSSGNKASASIDRFKVTISPYDDGQTQPYVLTVAEAAGCGQDILCYKVLYNEPTTSTKKLLAVQMKAGKMSVYEGEPVEGVTPLGVALDPNSCTITDVTE